MRLLLCMVGVGMLAAVVLGVLPLAWGFVALAIEIFVCFVAIYDLVPRPIYRDEKDN